MLVATCHPPVCFDTCAPFCFCFCGGMARHDTHRTTSSSQIEAYGIYLSISIYDTQHKTRTRDADTTPLSLVHSTRTRHTNKKGVACCVLP